MNVQNGIAAAATWSVSGLFADNMLLQRDAIIPLRGRDRPGALVTVRLGDAEYPTMAGADGGWEVRLGPQPAGGPWEIEICGSDRRVLTNVLFGDVWLCAGQSNMEMGLRAAENGPAEVAAAHQPAIRLCLAPKQPALAPPSDVPLQWLTCEPGNVGGVGWEGFSAVAYFFGREVQRRTGVPVGLIQAAWGGTVAEAWVSREGLATLGDFAADLRGLDQLAAAWQAGGSDYYRRQMEAWWRTNDAGSAATPGWEDPALPDADWLTMVLPQYWERAGLPDYDGVVWFRRAVELPADWAGCELRLCLGPVDDRDTTWFNGVRVGGLDRWDLPREYMIPAGVARAGTNVIAVRVLDTGVDGGFYGRPEQMRLERVGRPGAHAMTLAGPWRYRPTIELKNATPLPLNLAEEPNLPTVLYNGMIAPLCSLPIRGVLWYQGESNAGRGAQYRRLLPALIADWRRAWGRGAFPFYIVQLANFQANPNRAAPSTWAEIRAAQSAAARLVANCGLACTIDIGDAQDIHPRNKQEVGRRLALLALRNVYGQDVECLGPEPRGMRREDGAIQIEFQHAASGLVVRGVAPQGFEIAGVDGRFYPAAVEVTGTTVRVSSPQVPDPVHVRYGWADNPTGNLYNQAGLPCAPFRTDAE